MLPKFSYVRPTRLEEALSHLADKTAVIHAGGTDLLGCLRDGVITGRRVVSISQLQGLNTIQEKGNGAMQLGAMTTIRELSENQRVNELFPGLAQAAAEVASPQLRNQGTLGGNLCQKPRCWYYRGEFHCRRKGGDTCYALGGENQFHAIFGHDYTCAIPHPSDTAPVLVALGAVAHVQGATGSRQVAVEDLHVLPATDPARETVLNGDELITQVTIPIPTEPLYCAYRKIRARRAWDFALTGAGLALHHEGPRITKAAVVLSGVAPVPWRSKEAEEVLQGRELSAQRIAQAAGAAVADAQPLEKNGYKVTMLEGMLEEELTKARHHLSS